jgi:hypothetical protein
MASSLDLIVRAFSGEAVFRFAAEKRIASNVSDAIFALAHGAVNRNQYAARPIASSTKAIRDKETPKEPT